MCHFHAESLCWCRKSCLWCHFSDRFINLLILFIHCSISYMNADLLPRNHYRASYLVPNCDSLMIALSWSARRVFSRVALKVCGSLLCQWSGLKTIFVDSMEAAWKFSGDGDFLLLGSFKCKSTLWIHSLLLMSIPNWKPIEPLYLTVQEELASLH